MKDYFDSFNTTTKDYKDNHKWFTLNLRYTDDITTALSLNRCVNSLDLALKYDDEEPLPISVGAHYLIYGQHNLNILKTDLGISTSIIQNANKSKSIDDSTIIVEFNAAS